MLVSICVVAFFASCQKTEVQEKIYIFENDYVQIPEYDNLTIQNEERLDELYLSEAAVENRFYELLEFSQLEGEQYEISDDYIKSHFMFADSVESLKSEIRVILKEEYDQAKQQYWENGYFNALVQQVNLKTYDQDRYNYYEDKFVNQHKEDAMEAGFQSFQDYLKACNINNEEAFRKEYLTEEIEYALKQEYTLEAMEKILDLSISEKDINTYLEQFMQGSGYSREESLASLGKKDGIRNTLRYQKITDALITINQQRKER